jgi:predicted O-methyltransferase YrrM
MLLRKSPLDVTERDLAIMIDQLFGRRVSRYLECLEWGAGASTVFFPMLLEDNNIPYRWTSIEHNPDWQRAVFAERGKLNIDVICIPASEPAREPMDSYVDFPLHMGRKFDFIFVDGRKRRRCLVSALQVLAPNGVVILHDAHREYYHAGCRMFPHGEFVGDDLWIGRNRTA